MSDTVSIVLIIGVVVLVVLVALRGKLRKFYLKTTGFVASVEKQDRPDVKITGNVQSGKNHLIKTECNDVDISNNLQEGKGNVITTESDVGPKESDLRNL